MSERLDQPSRLALLFPGQGSQRVGMGKELAEHFPVAREVFRMADEVLGFHLSTLCFEGPEDELRLTTNTQPALLTTSIAAFRVLESEFGIKPALAAGHSLGEYSALVAAGVLEFPEAVKAVRARGQYMQEACPPGYGTMAAIIGLETETVFKLCEAASTPDEFVAPANLNAPGQIVVAGHANAVKRAVELAKAQGARMSVELNVSAPFHCRLMEPAKAAMAPVLRKLTVHEFRFPVIANTTAQLNSDPNRVADLLIEQITAPVRWEESMRVLASENITLAIEVGCGRVLCGLLRRIDKGLKTIAFEDLESLNAIRQAFGLN